MKNILYIMCLVLVISLEIHADTSYDRGKDKSVTCSACHGVDGNGDNKNVSTTSWSI